MKLRTRILEASGKPGAVWWMILLSFTESCVFVIPPDIMLVPMMLARPGRAYFNAFICTVSSVTGGAIGYLIGLLLLHQFAMPLIEFYGATDAYMHFRNLANSNMGVLLITTKALTPIPYKIVAIAAGAAEMSPLLFLLSSVAGRGLRYMFLAWLAVHYGENMKLILEKHGTKVLVIFILFLVLGFFLISFHFG